MPAQITALPTPPSTNDPANFNTRADAFLGQMPTFVTQANALATEVNANTIQAAADRVQTGSDRTAAAASAASALGAPGTNGSSTTSLTIGTGAKTFTAQTGKAWIAGQGFFLASSASPVNWMTGILTAYNSGTGAATVEVDTIGGSGTFAAWNCGLSAGRPIPLATQAQAEAGTDTASWMTPQRSAQAALAFGVPVGGVMQFAANPGSRWVRCNGQLYSTASYPALAAIMPTYTNPMTLRLSTADAGKIVYGASVFLVWTLIGGVWNPYTSMDGVSWTQRTNPIANGAPPTKLIFADGVFFALGGSAAYTSTDGVNWTTRSHPFGGTGSIVYGVARGGGMWMAVGLKNNLPAVATSPDGSIWTAKTAPSSQNVPYAIGYSPSLSRWLVCSNGDVAWTSENNGTNWTVKGFPSMYPREIIWGDDKFVVMGSSEVYCSSYGDEFVSTNFSGTSSSIFYDGSQFLVGTSSGTVYRSPDGVSWVSFFSIASGATIYGVARNGGSATAPYVVATYYYGLYSGLDLSTTQFPVPAIAGSPSGFAAYIKGI